MTDISAVIVFHAEGAFAIPAMRSFHELIDLARREGRTVEPIVICDRVDGDTLSVLRRWVRPDDIVVNVNNGDLSATRNAGAERATGDYLAFLDGDDLWSDNWISDAFAAQLREVDQKIWHPEALFIFAAGDSLFHSMSNMPEPGAVSHFMKFRSSKEISSGTLLLDNPWSANAFAHRSIFATFPYQHFDHQKGLGIEDWSWNMVTVAAGIEHAIVKDTIHAIRLKEFGSLGSQNNSLGLLPHIPQGVRENLLG